MVWLTMVPKKNRDIAWRVIDNETLLIYPNIHRPGAEKVGIFNETGTKIWELIDGNKAATGIVKKIIDKFDIEEKEARSQVKIFLDNLSHEGLIGF